jgi:hypothetical protein
MWWGNRALIDLSTVAILSRTVLPCTHSEPFDITIEVVQGYDTRRYIRESIAAVLLVPEDADWGK